MGHAGLWALLALAVAPALAREGAAFDRAGFQETDSDYVERLYVPCLRGLGGVPTALALADGRRLFPFEGTDTIGSIVERLMR